MKRQSLELDRAINEFNKDYPLFEKNIKFLIVKNNRLRFYIYILVAVIFILVLALVMCVLRLFYK